MLLNNPDELPEQFKKDKDVARVRELRKDMEQEAFWLNKESPFRTRSLEVPDMQLLEQMAWEAITNEGNYDDRVAEAFGLRKLKEMFDRIAIELAQERYRRFRGYSRDKMTTHAAQLMISNAIITEMFNAPHGPTRPDKSPADLTEEERGEIRHIVAALGTKQVIQILLSP